MNDHIYILILTLLTGIMIGFMCFALFIHLPIIEEKEKITNKTVSVSSNINCGTPTTAYYADNYTTTTYVYTK